MAEKNLHRVRIHLDDHQASKLRGSIMREQWARLTALLTGLLVLVLAVTFALLQNSPEPAASLADMQPLPALEPAASAILDTRDIEAGRAVYQAMACARCHAIAGAGNARNPLDHTGARHTAAELRDYIIGAEALSGAIPQYAMEFKQSYRELPEVELAALVVYMQSLRP